MDRLNEEINEFWKKSREELEAELSEANLDAAPTVEAIRALLVARDFHYFTLVANGAISKPVNDPERESTTTLSIGIGRALWRKISTMIDVRNESALDFTSNHLMFLNVGLMHGLTRVLVYTQLGHTLYSDDGVGHGYIGVGMKFMLNQRRP